MPHGTELCLTRVAHPPGRATPGRAPPAGPGSGRGRTAWCCCFTPAPGPATTGVSRGPGICIHHQPQAVLLPWAPAPSQNRWARGGRWVHGVGRTLLPFSPRASNRFLLLPFAGRGRPRRCFLQEVTPPGLTEAPGISNRLCVRAKEFFMCIFCFFLEPPGAGLPTAATPPGGHSRDCSIPSTSICSSSLRRPSPQGSQAPEGEEA